MVLTHWSVHIGAWLSSYSTLRDSEHQVPTSLELRTQLLHAIGLDRALIPIEHSEIPDRTFRILCSFWN